MEKFHFVHSLKGSERHTSKSSATEAQWLMALYDPAAMSDAFESHGIHRRPEVVDGHHLIV
jgi:hypothetical protein